MNLAIFWPVGAGCLGPNPGVMEHGWLHHFTLQAAAVKKYLADDFLTWGVQPLNAADGHMDLLEPVPLPKRLDDWLEGCAAVKCKRRWHYLWTPPARLLARAPYDMVRSLIGQSDFDTVLGEGIAPILATGYRVILDSAGLLWDLGGPDYDAIPITKKRLLLQLFDLLTPGDCGVEHASRKEYAMGARPSWTASNVYGPPWMTCAYGDATAAQYLDLRDDARKFWEWRGEFGDGRDWYRGCCWAADRDFTPLIESWQMDQLDRIAPGITCRNWREKLAAVWPEEVEA